MSEEEIPAGGAVDRDDLDGLVESVADHDEELAGDVADLIEITNGMDERLEEKVVRIEELEEEVADLEDRLKRTTADFKNYKKRQEREKERIRERATEDLIERLLEVRDNLERATTEESENLDGLKEGVMMTLEQFDRVLDAEGVEPIDPEPGTDTDPHRHEVMMRTEAAAPEGTIAEVYNKGFAMADSVLRPAQVSVSTGQATADDGESSGSADEAGAETEPEDSTNADSSSEQEDEESEATAVETAEQPESKADEAGEEATENPDEGGDETAKEGVESDEGSPATGDQAAATDDETTDPESN